MENLEVNPEWFIRSFEELDEKLPELSRLVVMKGIEYQQFLEEEWDLEGCKEDVESILLIMDENLECFSQMTAEEVDDAFEKVVTGCVLVTMVEDGLIEEKDGKYVATERGLACQNLLRGQENTDSA